MGEEFRPSFKRLGDLTCLFPEARHLALTATCTDDKIEKLCKSLLYQNTTIIKINPDRTNIYISKKPTLSNIHKLEKNLIQ